MPKTLPLLVVLLGAASPTVASTFVFEGTFSQQNPPAAGNGRCAPAARTVTFGPAIAPVAGTSNLGAFVPSGSHCINPPLPASYSEGRFTFDFGGGDTLVGEYDGVLTPGATPQVFHNLQNFTITGGSGRFLNALGSFQGSGSVAFTPGALPTSFQTFSGSFTAPVPEPMTWALMILGFGVAGARLRRARVEPA